MPDLRSSEKYNKIELLVIPSVIATASLYLWEKHLKKLLISNKSEISTEDLNNIKALIGEAKENGAKEVIIRINGNVDTNLECKIGEIAKSYPKIKFEVKKGNNTEVIIKFNKSSAH